MEDVFFLIAVHGGAGVHPRTSDAEVKKVLNRACRAALPILETGGSALDSVQEAVICLEDAECLNAGYGSNLTLYGNVECDASVMDSDCESFGSVGAVSGLKNPIKAARLVLDYSRIPDPLGRIPPMILVANGAVQFADLHGMHSVPSESLISPRARQEWLRWKATLGSTQVSSGSIAIEQGLSDTVNPTDMSHKQDTVGAIACASNGHLSAGVSSGGLLLKIPGRIGEAAHYGAGCWAKHALRLNSISVACSVSGAGEYIIKAALAKTVCDAIATSDGDDTHDILQRTLAGQPDGSFNAGVLLLVRQHEAQGSTTSRLWCAFTTESMAIAYASSLDRKPRALVLRKSRRDPHDEPFYVTALPLTRA
ncbi:N-terminal nucleophile aminohydrolase [Wolfiporia cocos MD-104 SS10]|uniref:N-terminal nucleophile aminohydrolase n=1 Tax=Wolfiporia cocos (strain MD-104) TaxID=742152 RepID=A0A2H3JQI5_WOLCO|nr:N-terminal nucleophile aminohydrolase [Wolfiporia cocos MD-104 SS10]